MFTLVIPTKINKKRREKQGRFLLTNGKVVSKTCNWDSHTHNFLTFWSKSVKLWIVGQIGKSVKGIVFIFGKSLFRQHDTSQT